MGLPDLTACFSTSDWLFVLFSVGLSRAMSSLGNLLLPSY